MPLKLIDGKHWLERPTGHESLTCKNHPNLRWSTKRIPGRTLFFGGEVTYPIKFYFDYSGVESTFTNECACPGNCLIPAPEDLFLRGKQSLEDYRKAEQNNFIDDRIIGNMRD